MQYPIAKCNDGNDTQIITTENMVASALLELQSQQVRLELQDDLKTNCFLESMEYPPKEGNK